MSVMTRDAESTTTPAVRLNEVSKAYGTGRGGARSSPSTTCR